VLATTNAVLEVAGADEGLLGLCPTWPREVKVPSKAEVERLAGM